MSRLSMSIFGQLSHKSPQVHVDPSDPLDLILIRQAMNRDGLTQDQAIEHVREELTESVCRLQENYSVESIISKLQGSLAKGVLLGRIVSK